MQLRALAAAVVLFAVACGGEDPAAVAPADAPAAAPQAATDAPALVTPPESYPSELASLRPLVGQYPRDLDLWNREPLASRLRALLGEKLAALVENTGVQSPLLEEEGILYVTGNKQHSGGSDAAAVVVDLRRDAVWVWLLVAGEGEAFLDRDVEVELPADVRITLENADVAPDPPPDDPDAPELP